MKTLMITLIALASSSTFAFADQASEIKRVRQLADRKISGSDVKKTVEVYDNVEGNPCAEPGINYIVKVSVRKTVRALDKDGNPAPKRIWEEANEYVISRDNLLRGQDVADDVCME